MKRNIKRFFKEMGKELFIAIFFSSLIIFIVFFFFNDKVNDFVNLVNMVIVKERMVYNNDLEFDIENKRLVKYPSYGTIWGTLKIDKLDIEQKIFYGDTLDILKKGVGHFAGSYFAGENGTIILSAHNSKDYFKNLPKLEIGDKIIITTDYGEFTYEVDNYKVIKDDDIDSFKIKNDEEMLILYTCYPTYTLGFKDERYIVYTKLVGEIYED